MCGILCCLSSSGISEKQRDSAHVMLDIQKHRGPDNTSLELVDQYCLLGHNRLSIIDLSTSANQPFYSENRQFCLVFNGEIYNYLELRAELEAEFHFRTSSDSEVLLYAFERWGIDCLHKLNGMFAFAVYNTERQELTVARDRFGVKPLYYAYDAANQTYLFASEIKTLHAYGVVKRANERVWANYLCYGDYHLGTETFWQDIYTLPAGHYAKIDRHTRQFEAQLWYDFEQRVRHYWDSEVYLSRTYDAHKEIYRQLIDESIQLRFRADVKVGINISGGIDSSLLLGAVNAQYPESAIEAFTFYCDDDRYDELPWVEHAIAPTNKPLNKVLLSASEIPELAQNISQFMDEPYGGIPTIAYSKVFETARAKGVLVLLDGQGMDEAWAGYDYYHQLSDAVIQGVQSSVFRENILSQEWLAMANKQTYKAPFSDAILNKQYRDLFYTKIPRALRFNDRISMMHSTELREPFLDYRLVEYAFAQPYENKIKNGLTKRMARDIAQSYVPDELSLAPKRALQTPQREWLGELLVEWVDSHIQKLKGNPMVKAQTLQQEWDAFLKSDKNNSFFVWQWISLSLMSDAFGD